MNAKRLERLMASHGANASAFGVVVRTLRGAFNIETSGQGIAHDMTVDEIAWYLAAYAGSEVAARADQTLTRLMGLQVATPNYPDTNWYGGNDFLTALQLILRRQVSGVQSVGIARNFDCATIRFSDGREIEYSTPEYRDTISGISGAAFRSEGVLTGALLDHIAYIIGQEN